MVALLSGPVIVHATFSVSTTLVMDAAAASWRYGAKVAPVVIKKSRESAEVVGRKGKTTPPTNKTYKLSFL
jgi:hypothetical protein